MGVIHLTPEELAERWHTTPGTLKDWRQKGREWGPHYIKFGRKVLYPLPEVERIEQARLMAATTVKAHE